VLADSSNVWERRIVQVELEADSLEEALRLRPVVRVQGQIRVDTLVIQDTVLVGETEDSVTTYRFGGEDGPFRILGTGRIFTSGRGIFDVRVAQVADIPVSARIGCQEAAGVNRAFVALSAEDPFTLIPSETVQEPDVCNRPPVRFSLLPEVSVKGIGWEIAKGVAFHLLWEWVEDQLESEPDSRY
jgi:hypothetical protein